jgi:hypothetical protein
MYRDRRTSWDPDTSWEAAVELENISENKT